MTEELTQYTTDIVSAYVSRNHTPAAELPALIAAVHGQLIQLANGKTAPVEEAKIKPVPAMPWRKTIHPDYLISLETGQKFKTLRRHVTTLGMTMDDYRAKWGLPKDYPSVAANYAAVRSQLAKQIGLGRKGADPVEIAIDLDVATEAALGGAEPEVVAEQLAQAAPVQIEAKSASFETAAVQAQQTVQVKQPAQVADAVQVQPAKAVAKKVRPHLKPKDRVRANATVKQDDAADAAQQHQDDLAEAQEAA